MWCVWIIITKQKPYQLLTAFRREKNHDKWKVIPHWTAEIRKANKSRSSWMAPGDMCGSQDLVGGVCDWHPLFGPGEERDEYKDILFSLQRPQYLHQRDTCAPEVWSGVTWDENTAVHTHTFTSSFRIKLRSPAFKWIRCRIAIWI